jgi:glutaredoxin-like protein
VAILSEKDRHLIQERLKEMAEPVKLVHFTRKMDCDLCPHTQQLLEELVSLSTKLSLEIFNFQIDKDKVAHYRVDKFPATILEGARDYGIRFYGLPAGYEFAVLLQDIVQVSRRVSGLSPESVEKLRGLTVPTHLEVFVTPTCRYCPGAVHLAHQLAIESDLVTADMVEATEFADLV